MRVLFVSKDDAADVNSWSGTPFHMLEALREAFGDVVNVSPLKQRYGFPFKAAQFAHNAVATTQYRRDREPLISRGYRDQIDRAIRRTRPDLIISPSTIPVSALRATDVPVVFWTDATFRSMIDYYPEFTNLSARYRRLGERMEGRALSRSALAVYTSEWAADSARDHYGAPPEKVAVVPYGANFAHVSWSPRPEAVQPLRLLSIGTHWERKGLDLAAELAGELHRRGTDVSLDIVGCEPPSTCRLPGYVRVHPRLDKAVEVDRRRLDRLLRSATFFVLPSRADCTPVVLAEAQAYGVPVLAARTGGIESMIARGEAGEVFELDDFVRGAADLVGYLVDHPGTYLRWSRAARERYETLLRWPNAARTLHGEIVSRGVL